MQYPSSNSQGQPPPGEGEGASAVPPCSDPANADFSGTAGATSSSLRRNPAFSKEDRDASAYQIRLAKDSADLEATFKLRYAVFYEEMGASQSASQVAGTDMDIYDRVCDHLIVTNQDEIVGTYRLLPIKRLKDTSLTPYSENEFSLSSIRSDYSDNLLELGRWCVHPDYRSGLVPRLLWAGVAGYMLSHDIQGMLGCASIHDISDVQALRLRDTFKERGMWDNRYDPAVKPEFALSSEAHRAYEELISMVPKEPSLLIPPLMKGYFNLGARVCGGPARDDSFHCHDFLILLDTGNIKPKYFNAFVKPLLEQATGEQGFSFFT